MDSASWQKCVELLEERISSNDHDRWVSLLSFCLAENDAYIVAPSGYFINLLNTKSIWQKIENICEEQGFTVPQLISRESREYQSLNIEKKSFPDSLENNQSEVRIGQSRHAISADKITQKVAERLKPEKKLPRKRQFDEYTFDNFHEGKSNQIALQVAKSLCHNIDDEQESLLYNPFFIYGHSGNGKTHLLHAIKNAVNSQDNHAKAFYQQAEGFVNRLVHAIRNKKMEEFKAFYRQYDMLLIDDVEFFVAKNSSMEEFFQLMNYFIEENRQIILTSDRLPTEIDLPHRIRSRLASGLSASISLPDFELRVNVLLSMANKLNLKISQDLIYLIATKVKVSIRELYGIIKTLKANMDFSFSHREITLNDIDGILAPTLRSMNVMVTPEQVSKVVSEYYGLSSRDLTSKARRRPIVFARHVSMFLMRENTNYSLEQIGQYFSRDHSSVIHAVRKVKEEMSKDSTVRQLIDGLTNRLLNSN